MQFPEHTVESYTAAAQTGEDEGEGDSKAKAKDKDAQAMEKVIVTGSLIPQTELETFTPVTIISAEDIKVRGYTQISDAVKESSFATGGVQGSQTSASFTQGAETASLFGLSVGYTKYPLAGHGGCRIALAAGRRGLGSRGRGLGQRIGRGDFQRRCVAVEGRY